MSHAGHPGIAVYGLVALDGDEVLAGGGELAVGPGGRHLDGLVLLKPARRLLHHGEDLGKGLVELARIHLEHLLAQVVDLAPEGLALLIVEGLDLLADLGHALLVVVALAAYRVAYHVDAVAKVVVGYFGYLGAHRVDLFLKPLPQGPDGTLALVAEYFL